MSVRFRPVMAKTNTPIKTEHAKKPDAKSDIVALVHKKLWDETGATVGSGAPTGATAKMPEKGLRLTLPNANSDFSAPPAAAAPSPAQVKKPGLSLSMAAAASAPEAEGAADIPITVVVENSDDSFDSDSADAAPTVTAAEDSSTGATASVPIFSLKPLKTLVVQPSTPPAIACWVGDETVAAPKDALAEIPVVDGPPDKILVAVNNAVRAFFERAIAEGIMRSKDPKLALEMRRALLPESANGGTSEKYWIKVPGNSDNAVRFALFKPLDGEKGLRASEGGIQPGEGGYAEVVASFYAEWLAEGLQRKVPVPRTCMAQLTSHVFVDPVKKRGATRVGSLQEYMFDFQGMSGISSPSLYCDTLNRKVMTLSDVQLEAMFVLDILLFNADRNRNNVGATESNEIVLIDHGGCISPTPIKANVDWMHWDSALVDCFFSSDLRRFMRVCSFEQICKGIRELFPKEQFSEERMKMLAMCFLLLKKGTSNFLTPREVMAFLMVDEQRLGYTSPLFRLIAAAEKAGPQKFVATLETYLDRTMEFISLKTKGPHAVVRLEQLLHDFIKVNFEEPAAAAGDKETCVIA